MPDTFAAKEITDDYLETLEEVKKLYQQYVEVSELYKLPVQNKEDAIQYEPPSLQHPLTTNTIRIKPGGRISEAHRRAE